MRRHSLLLGAGLILAACASGSEDQATTSEPPAPGTPAPGGVGVTIPLSLDIDLTRQTVAKAVCTRGNSYAKISVAPNGRFNGSLTDTDRSVAGTLVSRDTKTVELTVQQGTVQGETVGEAMQITTDGSRVYLTGPTFICRGVEVRPGG